MSTLQFTGPHGERMAPSAIVDTHLGPVQGLVVDGIHRFLGIRYGAPPLGPLRFKPPVDPPARREVAEAIYYGAPAIQSTTGPETSPSSAFALTQMVVMTTPAHVKVHNEDCLWLNVWTPGTDRARRPVMVWVHGGGFGFGSGDEPLYDGQRLARRGDVVIVTVNHRLNLFGYMSLTGTHEHYADAVNVGALDLVHALRWVKMNIAAFGGDPDNVTIAGESSGAAKVNALLATPSARDLFHKAILQSGAYPRVREGDAVREASLEVLAGAGVRDVDPQTLATVPVHSLLASAAGSYERTGAEDVQLARSARSFTEDLGQRLGTARDGAVVPRHPYEDGTPPPLAADVPVLMGWTKDEWNLMLVERDPDFVSMSESDLRAGARDMFGDGGERVVAALRAAFPDYRPGHLQSAMVTVQLIRNYKRIADLKSRQPAPVYCYQLSWETPVNGGIYRSTHALDLPFMFDNVAKARPLVGEGPEPQALADQMSEAWLAFLWDGDPNHAGIPRWERWSESRRTTMVFDVSSDVAEDPYGELDALTAESGIDFI